MKTVLDILQRSTDFLDRNGVSNARRQAEYVISDALGIDRLQLYMEHDRPLVESELEDCRKKIIRRAQKEPVQYIHGEVEFFDCQIKVNSNVLIPRQETEILVEKIFETLKKDNPSGKILLDLCCGSGCIGISLKKKFPDLTVICSDLSDDALKMAKANAELNQVDIIFLNGDLLKPLEGKKVNYLVCNPPYISESEYQVLEDEVKKFEPKLALVGGKSGLEIYERLANEMDGHLESASKIWFEIGHNQGSGVKNLFTSKIWKKAEVEKDWSGQNRFFFLEKE